MSANNLSCSSEGNEDGNKRCSVDMSDGDVMSSTIQKTEIETAKHEDEEKQLSFTCNQLNLTALQASRYKELESMLKLDAQTLLTTISGDFTDLQRLLNEDEIPTHSMLLLLKVFDLCFQEYIVELHRQNVNKLLLVLVASDKFRSHVTSLLTKGITKEKSRPSVLSALNYILRIGELLCEVFPASVCELFIALIPLIGVFIRSAGEAGVIVDQGVIEKVKSLEISIDHALKTTGAKPSLKQSEIESATQDPNDFRKIPVIPSPAELLSIEKTSIRQNIIFKKYADIDCYLDVHYRLLRHDFVAPLREGLLQYILPSADRRKKKNNNVRIYENVLVVGTNLTKDGVLFYFQLDKNVLKKIYLNASKGLLPGSLVCMSSDRFETMCIGVIADSDPKILQYGWIGVRMEVAAEIIIEGYSKTIVYTMVESRSYFEAYRHVLERMKQITKDQILLHGCITKCDSTADPPDYLDESINYDFTSVYKREGPSASIAVLQEWQWPTADNLGLDDAQLAAVKMCIRNKVAVIQGPPGTGKTFLGLKVANLLLNNSQVWTRGGYGSMLVVCYTNHALDQFLEGIKKFNESIVRIGGRSKSESLFPHQLSEVTHAQFKGEHYADRKMIRQKQDNIKGNIEHLEQNIANCKNVLVNAEKLYKERIINTRQFNFIKVYGSIEVWLGMHFSYCRGASEYLNDANRNASNELHKFTIDPEELCIDVDENDECIIEEMVSNNSAQETEYLIRKFIASETSTPNTCRVDNQQQNNDWKIQRSKRDLKRLLNQQSMMSKDEANSVTLSTLRNFNDRWRLYRYWRKRYAQTINAKIVDLHDRYLREVNALKELNDREKLHVLKNAKVIGATTTGAAKHWRLLQQIHLPVMVVEEAAEIFEAHIITALGRSTEHLILIGDHQQLRPSPTVYELAKIYNLDVSLFERLITNGVDYVKLTTQHRMRPEIARLICPHVYNNVLNHRSVCEYPNVAGITSNVYFLDHRHLETDFREVSKSNEHEANMVCELARYFVLQNYSPDRISILTTYSGQLFLIKNKVRNTIRYHLLDKITVTTVDNYQGEENDIILLSLVRSNEEKKIGFLKTDNRVCVALSRAKHGFYCIGNMSILAQNSILWSQINATLTQHNQIGYALRLECQNHPGTFTEVSKPENFLAAPDGGCSRLCEARLKCGHKCTKACHFYDSSHEEFVCQKICDKVLCVLEHKCQKRCHIEICKPCRVPVKKVIPKCKHEQMVPCSTESKEFSCRYKCSEVLSCGHSCKLKCGDRCSDRLCTEVIAVASPCGHTVHVECSSNIEENDLPFFCKKKCNAVLLCDHVCSGTCGTCHQGRIHTSCRKPCEQTLICGHVCEDNCASCTPCKKPCENMCPHIKCELPCGKPCLPCQKKCTWRCKHFQCNRLCSEPCDRPPCNVPCNIKLSCGHPCIGMCGELCPDKCRICDKEGLQALMFGGEDKPDARFVLLEDCKHLIEIETMDARMNRKTEKHEEYTAAVAETCPKCNKIIRKTVRYKAIINSYLNEIEKVKLTLLEDENANKRRLSKVKQNIVLSVENLPGLDECLDLTIGLLDFAVKVNNDSRERILFLSNLHLTVNEFVKTCEMMRSGTVLRLIRCKESSRYKIFLYNWLKQNMIQATVQQLKEFSDEFVRFILFKDLTYLMIKAMDNIISGDLSIARTKTMEMILEKPQSSLVETVTPFGRTVIKQYAEAKQILLMLTPLSNSDKRKLKEIIRDIAINLRT
ncbi:ZNFX1 (predicted) [Pycnogonum litorale]